MYTKKLIAIALPLMLSLACICSFLAPSQDVNGAETNGYEYTWLDEYSGYKITCASQDLTGDVTIPSEYDDGVHGLAPVVYVGFCGYCTLITSITTPGSVKIINNDSSTGAFTGSTSLSKVTLNEGLETIGPLSFGNSVYTWGNCVISNDIVIPSTVTSIGAYAFNVVENSVMKIEFRCTEATIDEKAFTFSNSGSDLKFYKDGAEISGSDLCGKIFELNNGQFEYIGDVPSGDVTTKSDNSVAVVATVVASFAVAIVAFTVVLIGKR